MRINALECWVFNYPIIERKIVFSCAGAHTQSRFLIVRVTDSEGVHGFGEAATVPIWSGESAESASQLLKKTLYTHLVGSTFDHPSEISDLLNRLLIANSFLKSAIDTAAWDLFARRQQKSVSSLIADREPVPLINVRVSIAGHGVERTVELAKEFWGLGIKTLKLKTGIDVKADCLRLAAIRDQLGDEPVLTVDYNNGLSTLHEAVEAITALLPYDIALAEQPTPRDRLNLMAQVRKRVPVPILADEAIFNRQQLQEAIELEAMDILSLYPGKNGGFTNSLEMAHMAQQAGIPCVIGSNLETELGQAAMGCLASSLEAFPLDRYSVDISSTLYYEDSEVHSRRPLQEGRYCVPKGDGFGIIPNLKGHLPQ